MFSGFLVVKLLEPAQLGLFNGVGVYLGYILCGHLGVLNGFGREFPYQMAKGNRNLALRLASSGWWVSLVISAVSSFFFLIVSLYNFYIGNVTLGIVYFSYVFIGFFYLINSQFLPLLYRNDQDFIKLSKQNNYFGLANIITVLLVFYFEFHGLILRGILLAAFQFYLLFMNRPMGFRFISNRFDLKLLFLRGWPIFVIGYVNALWITLLYTIVYKIGGPLNFGLFSIGTIVQSAIGVIPSAFGQILYPRMTSMYANGRSLRFIISSNMKVLIVQFVFLLCISIVLVILIPYLIPIFLPKYSGGILAAQYMCFLPVLQSFDSLNNIYNVVGSQKMLFISLFIGAFIGLAFILLKIYFFGFTLEIVPQSLLLGVSIQQFLSLYFLHRLKY